LQDATRAIRRSILELVLVWRERCRSRRLLAAMSERELRDIGISWADIAEKIDRPFWEP
jgi:uncharacterized protein YjiS (DUF1127 family)